MTYDEIREEILKDPTRCYQPGCDAENEILLHITDNPWGGSDLCWQHARQTFKQTPLVWTCECTFCDRARRQLARHEHEAADGAVLCRDCTGRHLIQTADGTMHVVDLDDHFTVRFILQADGELRAEGEATRLLGLKPVVVGEPGVLVVDLGSDDPDYVGTPRSIGPVLSVDLVVRDA